MKTERVSYIDVARGIGILLVIYGHGLAATPLRYIIYSFHMPLFFFLSGLVFKKSENQKYKSFFIKDFKRIMIPYFIFAFLSYLLWLSNIPLQKMSSDLLSNQIFGVFYGNGNNRLLAINIVLWFLPCLFLTKQIFWFISKLPNKIIIISLLIFSITGFLFSIFFPQFKLPLGFETMLTSIVFFGLGYLWNFLPLNINQTFKKYALSIFILCLAITIPLALVNFNLHNHQIDLRLNILNNYFLFYICAITGILATLSISLIINKNKTLEYLGQNTLVLFVWHLVIFSYISRVVFLFITPEKVTEFRNILFAPMYTVISIMVILSLNQIYKKLRKLISLKH